MSEPIDVNGLLQRAADKAGFRRERYAEADVPTSFDRLTILPFFGDPRSQFVMSSLLLHRYMGEVKSDRYFVLAGFPGLGGLFPYVDEYWGVRDAGLLSDLAPATAGFGNESRRVEDMVRVLRQYVGDVVTYEDDLRRYYDKGLTKDFFDTFGRVHVFLPGMRAARVETARQLSQRPGYKVFVHPTEWAVGWRPQGFSRTRVSRQFWLDLCEGLFGLGAVPVVWQPAGTHDLSTDLGHRAVTLSDHDILDVLAAMRACSAVVDVFSGVSRYAAVARCPYVAVEDRQTFSGLKAYEIDDLAVLNKEYRYVFSYPPVLDGGRWETVVDSVVGRLRDLFSGLNRDAWPPTSEYVSAVSYSVVRKRENKRLGTHFIKVPRVGDS